MFTISHRTEKRAPSCDGPRYDVLTHQSHRAEVAELEANRHSMAAW